MRPCGKVDSWPRQGAIDFSTGYGAMDKLIDAQAVTPEIQFLPDLGCPNGHKPLILIITIVFMTVGFHLKDVAIHKSGLRVLLGYLQLRFVRSILQLEVAALKKKGAVSPL